MSKKILIFKNDRGGDLVSSIRLIYKLNKINDNLTIYLSAHEHSYERICPIYDGQCQDGLNKSSSFNNSKLQYPIHIISGAAGCREGHEKFINDVPFWSVLRNYNSGYGILDVNYDRLKWYEYVVNETNQDTYLIDYLEILNQ